MNDYHPKITIITVTFNAADTLERTLLSIESQTYDNIEHIIKDGGSTDATLQLAEAYKQRNPQKNIVVTAQPDKGLYDAMNAAIRLSTGDYICFLNAGDKLHSNDTIERLVETVPAKTTPAVIYGETDIVDNEGQFLSHRRLKAPEKLAAKSFANGMIICHQSFYVLREIAFPYDTKYRFSADFDWCIRIMKEAEQLNMPFVNTHMVLTDYLNEGKTTKNHKASLMERFRIMSKHYGFIPTLFRHIYFAIRSIGKPIN